MLCQKCQKNNATVKIVINQNGSITEKYLCQACAGNEDIHFTDFSKDGIFNLFNALSPVSTPDLTCPMCKTSYKEFKKSGKFGCAQCFSTFEKYLDPLFKNIHSADSHTGKLPKRCGEHIKLKKQKEDLKAMLQKAILEERYEDAAQIRDQIRQMEG